MPAKRKPIDLLARKRKDRLEDRINELALPAGPLGPPPEWFGATAIEEWNRLTVELAAVLNPAHRSGLIALCALTQREVDEFKDVGKISASERQTLHSLRMQFAAMPASQSKIKMPEKKLAESKWGATKPIPISKPA